LLLLLLLLLRHAQARHAKLLLLLVKAIDLHGKQQLITAAVSVLMKQLACMANSS
jgi:hypothetical protein